MKRISTIKKDVDELHNQICINHKINISIYAQLDTHFNKIKEILEEC